MDTKQYFVGDTNKLLNSKVQLPLRDDLIRFFFIFPCERFSKSASLFGFHKDLAKFLKVKISIDLQIYKSAYNLLAAYFRYSYAQLIQNSKNFAVYELADNVVPTGYDFEYDRDLELKECSQGNLFEPGVDLVKCTQRNWISFIHHELLRLTYQNEEFALAVIVAALKQFVVTNLSPDLENDSANFSSKIKKLLSERVFAQNVLSAIILDEYNMHDWIFANDLKERERLLKTHADLGTEFSSSWRSKLQDYINNDDWKNILRS